MPVVRTTKKAHYTHALNTFTALLELSDMIRDEGSTPMLTDSENDGEGDLDSDNDLLNDVNDEADELEDLAIQQLQPTLLYHGQTRGPYNQMPKSKDFFSVLLGLPDREFRSEFRIGRDTFDRLVGLLYTDPVFQSTGWKPQRHVKFQLAAFLLRYGSIACDTMATAIKLSIGHGTVLTYCRRVTEALRRLKPKFVSWGTTDDREKTKDAVFKKVGLHGCIGSLDGTLIPFNQRPDVEGKSYVSRKGFPSANIQASVDHRLRFTSYEIGWPGSAPDCKIFKHSDLWKNRNRYFQEGEFILVDKAYMSSPFTLRPFDEREILKASQLDARRMRSFNQRLSRSRIWSEHAFGKLKGRFRSLKCFAVHDTMMETFTTIEALLILHNICIDFGDQPEWILNFDTDKQDGWDSDSDMEDGDLAIGRLQADIVAVAQQLSGEVAVPDWQTDTRLKAAGKQMRLNFLEELFPCNYY